VDQLALSSFLSTDESFVYCKSPTCTAGHLHEGGPSRPIFRCSACACRSCVPCGVLWHEDLTCEPYQQVVQDAAKNDEIARQVQDRLVTEEAASIEAVEALSKACPNKACGARIEKNGGCDHMTVSMILFASPVYASTISGDALQRWKTDLITQCRRCHTDFCWSCMQVYHQADFEDCECYGSWLALTR